MWIMGRVFRVDAEVDQHRAKSMDVELIDLVDLPFEDLRGLRSPVLAHAVRRALEDLDDLLGAFAGFSSSI
jgi:FXSXX-COOH protein